MNQTDRLAQVADAMLRHDTFVLTCHVDPDPDCIGSMLALEWGLGRLGKRVTMVSSDPIKQEARFLPGAERVIEPPAPPADALIVVDCELSRIGKVRKQAGQYEHIYNIDHHVTNDGEGTIHYIDPQAAATGEIVFRILTDCWRLPLDASVATNLYAALMTDTGSFRFSNTTAATLHIAAHLVAAGARPDEIAAQAYEYSTWNSLQLLKQSLNTVDRSADGRIAWIVVDRAMLEATGAVDDDAAGFVQYPRSIIGVDVAFMLRELPDGQTRVSLRSRGTADVSVVASRFGGGGHPGAAGCTINAPIPEALEQVVAEVRTVLPPPPSETPSVPGADRPPGSSPDDEGDGGR